MINNRNLFSYIFLNLDLKQELKVKERVPVPKKEDSNENISVNGHIINSTCSQVETETQTLPVTPQKSE